MVTLSNAYKRAGVDIEAGYESVSRMKKHVSRTQRPEVLGALGGFGGMFDLSALSLKEPVLVSGTDGVGTKLLLAMMMDKHDTIGVDCVAMCVNDIIAQGAEPLYFLDYVACGKADPKKIEAIVKGIADGCEQAGCALIGGETAEMPGMYSVDEYDLAGFTVGAAEKRKLIDGSLVRDGDVLIGLPSSGIHSNGFSLVRKVLLDESSMKLDQFIKELDCMLGEELLRPTKIYVKPILEVLKSGSVHGIAHITGGGFIENIPRMLPDGFGAEIKKGTWEINPIFNLIKDKGSLEEDDMYSIFNMGIGMVLAVQAEKVSELIGTLNQLGEDAKRIGRVIQKEGVHFR